MLVYNLFHIVFVLVNKSVKELFVTYYSVFPKPEVRVIIKVMFPITNDTAENTNNCVNNLNYSTVYPNNSLKVYF